MLLAFALAALISYAFSLVPHFAESVREMRRVTQTPRALSLQHVVMLGMGIILLRWLLLNPKVEFTYYRSSKPFPNQGFARVAFNIAGIVLLLGGLWSLWIDWHAGR